MTGSGRRLAVRLAIAACAAAAMSAPATVSEAAGPLKLSVQVGYHNLIKLGEWMPVAVDVSNSGPDFEGTLEVAGDGPFTAKGIPSGGAVIYETPASLAAGATKHFRTYVSLVSTGTIDVRMVQNGRIVVSQQAPPPVMSGLLAGVLSDRLSTLDQLGALRPGGSAPGVSHLSVADLPDAAALLRGFDLLAVDDFSTDTLTAAQRAALDDYVTNGGSLLLGTGGSWRKTLSSLPSDLLPMNVSGTSVLAAGGLAGVEVVTGTLNGATAWMSSSDGLPLLVEKKVGQGLVAMAAFDWNQELGAGYAQSAAMLRQVLVRTTYGMGATANGTPGAVSKFGFTNSIAAKGSQFTQALSNLQALTLPAWWLIGALVLAYVLVVGPINYLVLRAINRRALAWVTVPAIALVASGCAYGAGVATKGTAAQASEASIIHVSPGAQHASIETYAGLIVPARGDYNVGITGHPIVSPIETYYGQQPDPQQVLIRVNTVNDGITLPSMVAFSPRGFASEGTVGAPRITGTARLAGGFLSGAVQNQSQLSFTDGVIVDGNAFQKLPQLTPGGSITFNLAPGSVAPFAGPPAYMGIYPNMYTCCPPAAQRNNQSDTEREAELRTAVLATLQGSGFTNGFATPSPPVIVLWTNQSFQDVTVNGSHPRTYGETAVVLTLPVSQIGPGQVSSGVVQGRVVDVDAEFQLNGGPPGLLMAQSGSVTYEFSPALAPGMHLTSAAISSAAGGFVTKPGPTSGTTAGVKAQVWDWAQSAWTDVRYAEAGSTSIPDSAVDPATGMVRMRVSSDGPFSTGYLSLTGTVA